MSHFTKTKNLLIISSAIAVSLFVGTILFTNLVLYAEPNELWKVLFVCDIGLRPMAFSVFLEYNNGTHTIDMSSCGWIPNDYKSLSHDQIRQMSCEELRQRNKIDIPFKNTESKTLFQAELDLCNFVEDFRMDQLND